MLQDIKLVLFDLDNTLFSFVIYYTQATKYSFNAHKGYQNE